jgi:hypothetical protein
MKQAGRQRGTTYKMSISVMDSATETPYSAERSSWARGGMSSGGL